MNKEMYDIVKNRPGFIAALDQSGGSTGKALKNYGINEDEFLDKVDDLAELAHQDQCTGTNPRYPLISEIKDIYLKCYYGK